MGGIESVKFFDLFDTGHFQLSLLAGNDPWVDLVLLGGIVDAPEQVSLHFVDVEGAADSEVAVAVEVVAVESAAVVAVESAIVVGSVFDADVDNAAGVGVVAAAVLVVDFVVAAADVEAVVGVAVSVVEFAD